MFRSKIQCSTQLQPTQNQQTSPHVYRSYLPSASLPLDNKQISMMLFSTF